MPSARLTEHLPHAPADMMDLVTSVEKYPEFLSFVSGMRIIGGKQCIANGERFEAEMAVRYKMITERVRCIVQTDTENGTVKVSKADKSGPIKALANDWTFYPMPDGTTLVDLTVDVTLKAFPLNMLVKQKFGDASDKILSAFKRRAAGQYRKLGDSGLDVRKEAKALGIKGFA